MADIFGLGLRLGGVMNVGENGTVKERTVQTMVKCVAEKCDYFNEHGECSSACINNGYKKVLTNYDRIKNMTVEELAEYIFDLGNGSEYCYGHCAFQDDKDCPFPHGCMLGVVKWLESEEWTE